MAIILLVATFAVGGLLKWQMVDNTDETNNWKQAVQQDIQQYTAAKQGAEEGSFVYKKAEEQIQIAKQQLADNNKTVEQGSFWWSVDSLKSVSSLIILFGVIMGASIVSSEYTNGTIKLLAIRPVSRGKILLSKYLTVIGATIVFAIGMLFVSMIASIVYFPYEGTSSYMMINGEVSSVSPFWGIAKWYVYSFVGVIAYTTISFFIATLIRSNAMAIGITMFLLFTSSTAMTMLYQFDWYKYVLFGHTGFSSYLSINVPFTDIGPLLSLGIVGAYVIAFYLISYLSFTKRDIAV